MTKKEGTKGGLFTWGIDPVSFFGALEVVESRVIVKLKMVDLKGPILIFKSISCSLFSTQFVWDTYIQKRQRTCLKSL